MKKLKKAIASVAIASIALLGSCNNTTNKGSNSSTQKETEEAFYAVYSDGTEFSADGKATVSVGDNVARIACYTEDGGTTTVYFSSSDSDVLDVSSTGKLTAKKEGSAVITAKNKKTTINITFTVTKTSLATGGISYTSESYEEKAEMLAALEKYAVDNYLTGITLFSNGSKIAYNERYVPQPKSYINGYGWGTTREGKLSGELANAKSGKKSYYNIGTTSLPAHANAMDASGSDVSTVYDYISSAYFGTRMNETNDGYEWYPILSTDDSPIAVEEPEEVNDDGTVKTPGKAIASTDSRAKNNKRWRIHLRSGVKYRTGSSDSFTKKYDGTEVSLNDYLTPLKFMLTAWNSQYRGAELTTGTSGFTGAASYYNSTKQRGTTDGEDDLYKESTWNSIMGSNIYVGHDEGGDFIEFNLLESCTQFYAMYYLSSSLYSPLPESFIKNWYYTDSKGNIKNGLGKSPNGKTPLDTMLSVGPYYIETWDSQVINFKKNDQYFITKDTFEDGTERSVYNIDGISYNYISDSSQLVTRFENGEIDSYSPKASEMSTGGTFANESGTTSSGVKWRLYETKGDSNFKLNVNACTEEYWINQFGKNGKVAQVNYSTTTWKKLKSDLDGKTPETACKPYMSNVHFLNFLSFSLDRKTICESRGSIPTQEYFSDNYIIDPEKGISYNSTEAHKAVLADRYNDTYGYNETYARSELEKAFEEVIVPLAENGAFDAASGSAGAGTKNNKWQVIIDMEWMNKNDRTDYKDIFRNTKKIFDAISEEYYDSSYELVIEDETGNSDYQQVYTLMKQGQFDLGFGAISGNTLNPIDFFEVLKSDNSSTFTLNWGADTSVVGSGLYETGNEKNTIVYDGKTWSFDGLWAAADKGTLLNTSGGIAKATNASTQDVNKYSSGVFYESVDANNHSITYKISFDQLIQAGASKIRFTVSNASAKSNWKYYSVGETISGYTQLELDANNVVTLTIGDGFNYSEGSKERDATGVVLSIEYQAGLKNGNNGDTITKSFTESMSLVTYYSTIKK